MILRQHLLLYGIILSNYYYYLIQYTTSSPPPPCLFFCHLPSLSTAHHPPPAFVAILSLAVFVTTRSHPIVHSLRLMLSHCPPYPSGLATSSTASRPRGNIAAAIIAATPCCPLLIACSRHVVHQPPTVLPRSPPCSNRSRCAFRRPLLLRRPTARAKTSTLPLSPLMSRYSHCETLMSTLTTRGKKK